MTLHRGYVGILIGLVCLALPVQRASAAADAIQTSLTLIGGAHHVFVVGAEAPKLHLSLSSQDHQAHHVDVSLRADDLWGRPTDWKRNVLIDLTGPGTGATDIDLPKDVGFYDVSADFTSGAFYQTNHIEMAVVYPPAKGIRPDSFFASNTSNIKSGEDLLLLERIGMKIQRFVLLREIQRKRCARGCFR